MGRLSVSLGILATCASFAGAQMPHPVAAGARLDVTQRASRTAAPRAFVMTVSDSSKRPIWPWVVGGTLVGAAVGGIKAGVAASHVDDAFFPMIAIEAGVAVGAVSGAVVGLIVGGIVRAAGS